MNDRYQLLPHKHVRFADSLLALAGAVRQHLSYTPQTLDAVWMQLERVVDSTARSTNLTFSQFLLAVDILYAIKVIEPVDGDAIRLMEHHQMSSNATN